MTLAPTSARVLRMTDTVQSLFDAYASAYSARDMEEVTDLCRWPFLAVRRGEAIHLPDRDAVRDHFASAIEAYRFTGSDSLAWTPVEIDTRELGEHSVFATVHWNAVDDADGRVGSRHVDELSAARVLPTVGGSSRTRTTSSEKPQRHSRKLGLARDQSPGAPLPTQTLCSPLSRRPMPGVGLEHVTRRSVRQCRAARCPVERERV